MEMLLAMIIILVGAILIVYFERHRSQKEKHAH